MYQRCFPHGLKGRNGLYALGLSMLCSACENTSQVKGLAPYKIDASRTFADESEYPPSLVQAYGILAFPRTPGAERGEMFCRAFHGGLTASEVLIGEGIPLSRQMVTVWPIKGVELAEQVREAPMAAACDIAVSDYDTRLAERAIAAARAAERRGLTASELAGAGPFLLAWSPGSERDDPQSDTLVLVADLSTVEDQASANRAIRRWKYEIQNDSSLWATGFSLERIKLKIQDWAVRRGDAVLWAIGGKEQ